MKLHRLILLLLILLAGKDITAQTFEGTWKGTSLCQVKNSPCHDEVVVYHIAKDRDGKTYSMSADKIVNGEAEDMGTLIFTYDSLQKSFVSINNEHKSKWEFKITGNTMKGTLISGDKLYRLVDVKKENP